MLKVAAVTMAYNERVYLPIWLRHYSTQVGLKNCFVVDHGSSDGSTSSIGEAGYVPLPRDKLDERARSQFISDFCNSLLHYYDWVVYADADELLIADPNKYQSLAGLFSETKLRTIRSIGINVIHRVGENAVDPDQFILSQRKYGRFSLAMCKPNATSVAVKWVPGFHDCSGQSDFDNLFMFHIALCDRGINLSRLARTRELSWESPTVNDHQRVTDEQRNEFFDTLSRLPLINDMTFDNADKRLAIIINDIRRFRADEPEKASSFYIHLSKVIHTSELWRIPNRFSELSLLYHRADGLDSAQGENTPVKL